MISNGNVFQPNKQRDIMGQKFGRLTPVEFCYRDQNHNHYWKFKCDCGKEIIARKNAVVSGNTKSCGCLQSLNRVKSNTTHGMSKSRLYKEWAGIIQRCENKNSTSYDRYGNLGIKVCSEWHVFENFNNWAIQNGYCDDLTIDRIDTSGNYEPSNCRWANNIEQANNKSTNVFIAHNGELHTLAEWARITKTKYHCLYARYQKAKDPDRIFRGLGT